VDAQESLGLLNAKPGSNSQVTYWPLLGGDVAAFLPGLDHAIHGGVVVDLRGWMVGRLDASTRMPWMPRSLANSEFLTELFDVLRLIVGVDQFLAPEVGGDAAEAEPAPAILAFSSARCDFSGMAPGQFLIRAVRIAGIRDAAGRRRVRRRRSLGVSIPSA
jgi:hypothetical protein